MGTTMLVVTHEQELVNRFGKRVVAIENGRIISDADRRVLRQWVIDKFKVLYTKRASAVSLPMGFMSFAAVCMIGGLPADHGLLLPHRG